MKFKLIKIILLIFFTVIAAARAEAGMDIILELENGSARAILEDNAAAAQLAAMMPFTLEMRDYNRTEKIAQPPAKIDLKNAPRGVDPKPGDIAIFAPWGNLCIFYHAFESNSDLVPIGRITSGLELLSTQKGNFKAVWKKAP